MTLSRARAIRNKLFEFLRYGALGGGVYLVASHWVRQSSGPKEGVPAASFDLQVAGETRRVSLTSQRGKPVVMEVFASWCSACKRSAPRLAEAFRAHHRDDVTFLAVSVDEDPNAAARAKADWRIPFDVVIDDGSVSRGYGISMLPTLIYIDAQGTVRHAAAGVASRSEVEDWISER